MIFRTHCYSTFSDETFIYNQCLSLLLLFIGHQFELADSKASIIISIEGKNCPSFIKSLLRKFEGSKLAEHFLRGAHHLSLYFSNGKLLLQRSIPNKYKSLRLD